jgi:hypothetical protein
MTIPNGRVGATYLNGRGERTQADTIRVKVRFGRGPELRNGVVALGGQLSVGGR